MMILFVLYFINVILMQINSYEIPRTTSNEFLKSKISSRSKYEESKEIIETKRESCIDEYRQQEKSYQRRQLSSTFCTQYCSETMDCQRNNEQSACINPAWPSRTIKYVQKVQRTCYIRITEVLRYEQAERMCRRYGLQLAIIDNIPLLERLKQLNMFNATCKGQCPTARGYYIGLKRLLDMNTESQSQWIWSNNVTWTQNETDCDDYSDTSYANTNFLCYIGNDGEKKVTVWNEGEPNNYFTLEQCVEIIANTDKKSSLEQIGKLNDIPCTKPTLGVICQMEDIKPMNSTRFEYFATIVGFNETDLLNNLLSNFDGPISANLDAMAAMAAALEGLLVLPSFTTEQATTVLNVVDQLVNVTGQVDVEDDSLKKVTNKLLQFLDRFPTKIQLNNERSGSFEYESMNVSIVNIHFEKEDNEWFMIKSRETKDENPTTIIEINIRVLQKRLNSFNDYRIIETIFSNFNLFPQTNMTNFGIPISFQIANLTMIRLDEDLIRFQIRVSESIQLHNVSCAYWSFDENNGSWVTDGGCRFVGYVNDYAQCYCNHLTHFALLMLSESEETMEPLSTIEEYILTFVTYIGICLSIFGLIMTLITYALFRRSQRNHLHWSLIMLCLSILFVNCLYIPFSLTKPNLSHIQRNIFCSILGFLFHYFFLASFMWMFIMAIIQYMRFVRIFNTHISHFFIKTCLIGWIIPFIFPSVVVIFGSNGGYAGKYRCWINREILLYLTFIAPTAVIIMFNLILFGITLKGIFQHNTSMVTCQKTHSKVQTGAALCCFVSIGCTWLFGIVVLIQPNFLHQLIFCICNSFQGFLIFLFHVYLSKPKRELWQTFLIERGLHPRLHVSSGHTDLTTISNSTGGNISGLTRPVKFRFSATSSSSNDQQRSVVIMNPALLDHKNNGVLNKDQLYSSRLSNLTIRKQQEHLLEQIQHKTKMGMNNSYA